ncbi:MAG: AroM family protein [Anaerolineae bacterium]|nr:AroM family protein [Anaerolineae bacterium]
MSNENTPPLLGIITIGQSPRPDFERAFGAHALNAEVRVLGALDGLSHAEIDALAAKPTDYPLLVKLADQSTRSIGMTEIHRLVQQRAHDFDALGAKVIVVACAGGFPDIESRALAVLPGKLLPALANAIAPRCRIGIVSPLRQQAPAAETKWRADGFDPIVTWMSPFGAHQFDEPVAVMSDPSIELVVLDCLGHTDDDRREFARRCGKPVLLAQTIAARVAGELIG